MLSYGHGDAGVCKSKDAVERRLRGRYTKRGKDQVKPTRLLHTDCSPPAVTT